MSVLYRIGKQAALVKLGMRLTFDNPQEASEHYKNRETVSKWTGGAGDLAGSMIGGTAGSVAGPVGTVGGSVAGAEESNKLGAFTVPPEVLEHYQGLEPENLDPEIARRNAYANAASPYAHRDLMNYLYAHRDLINYLGDQGYGQDNLPQGDVQISDELRDKYPHLKGVRFDGNIMYTQYNTDYQLPGQTTSSPASAPAQQQPQQQAPKPTQPVQQQPQPPQQPPQS